MKHLSWIDEIIYDELDKKGVIHFNKMRSVLNEKRSSSAKEVTKATLSTHLKKMVHEKILDKPPHKPGSVGSYKFTETAKILRKIKAFEGVKGKKDHYDFNESKYPDRVFKKTLRKLLYVKGIGVTKIAKQTISKSGNITVNEIYNDNSFSHSDIVKNQPVNSTNVSFSSNVKIKDEDVKNIIHVCNEYLRIIDPGDNFNMTEFHKKNKIIKQYLAICCEISTYVRLILESIGTHLRKLTKTELAWYNETMGQDELINFLEYKAKERKNEVREILQKRPELKIKYLDEVKRRISVYDQLIIARQKELEELLKIIDEKSHPIFNLINNLSYPKFMRDLHLEKKV